MEQGLATIISAAQIGAAIALLTEHLQRLDRLKL